MLYITYMKNYSTLKKELLQKKEVKDSYNKLGPEFSVIEKLIEQRIQKGLSQVDLAKKAGTKQSAISRFESGTSNPSLQFLYKIADALGVTLKVSVSGS